MADKPLAPNTIRSRFDHVRAVIHAAVADRAIPFDVTASVTLPRLRKAEAAMTIPTTAEVGAAMQQASVQVVTGGGVDIRPPKFRQ